MGFKNHLAPPVENTQGQCLQCALTKKLQPVVITVKIGRKNIGQINGTWTTLPGKVIGVGNRENTVVVGGPISAWVYQHT